MTTLQYILSILGIALGAAQGLAGGPGGNVQNALSVAQALEKIIQSALTAYQQHTGQPIDPELLKPMQGIAQV